MHRMPIEPTSAPSLGPCSGPPVTDLDLLHNRLASRKRQTGNAAEWSSTPTPAAHNQHLAGQCNLHNAEVSQGYGIARGVDLDCEEDLAPATLNNDTIASQNQYRHHGSTSSLETSEGVSNPAVPVAPQQAPGLQSVSEAETERELEAFLHDQVCTCASCLCNQQWPWDLLERLEESPKTKSLLLDCRVPGCQWTSDSTPFSAWGSNLKEILAHERDWSHITHYGKSGDWRCREVGCKFVTKRWKDFIKRHTLTQHCKNPPNFKCPVLGCKYHEHGFVRQDKLKSHHDKVHKGKFRPGKPNQVIKPKVKDCA